MRVGVGDTNRAQSDPNGVYYDAIESWATTGKPPSRAQVEELIVAACVLTQPELVPFVIAGIALIEGAEWVAHALGIGSNFCDNPPIDENDVRWIHFNAVWPNGIPSGPFASPAPGSFEAFALPILQINWEKQANCRAFLDYRIVLDVLAAKWNDTHAATTPAWSRSSSYWQLPDTGSPFSLLKWPTGAEIFKGSPPTLPPWQHAVPLFSGYTGVLTDDHDLVINRGALQMKIVRPPHLVNDTSTATKVATGAAAVGGAAVIAVLVTSWIKGQSINYVLGHAWKGVKKAVRR